MENVSVHCFGFVFEKKVLLQRRQHKRNVIKKNKIQFER